MPWTKPGTGRIKGSKNKRTIALEEKLEEMGCDPIKFMASVMMDTTEEMDLRCKMATELAQYIAPKRKAVEHTTPDGAPLFVIMGTGVAVSDDEWVKQHAPGGLH